MKTSSKLLSLGVAGLMASTSLGFAATASAPDSSATPTQTAPKAAQATTPETKKAPDYATQKEMLKTASDALAAVQNAHDARLAIFNDRTGDAKTLINQAIASLSDGKSSYDDLMVADTGKSGTTEKTLLPFDVSLGLSESFDATEENKLALQKAYGLFQSAEPDDAIDVLRLASIDVQVTAAQLPVEHSMKLLNDAKSFIDKGEYHQANLALKNIEDSVVVRSFGIDAIPEQGNVG